MTESVEWEKVVRPGGDACAGCAARLGPGAEVVTALEIGPAGLLRQDRCPACHAGLPAEPFSWWRHRREKAQSGPRRLDLGWLTEFFKRLDTRPDDLHARRVAWIVTLLLLRRRILEEVARERDGDTEILTVRLRKEEREYRIQDPRLDAAAMMTIEDDLARIFNLETPAAPVPEATTPAAPAPPATQADS